MSLRLRVSVLAALALAGSCPAAEPLDAGDGSGTAAASAAAPAETAPAAPTAPAPTDASPAEESTPGPAAAKLQVLPSFDPSLPTPAPPPLLRPPLLPGIAPAPAPAAPAPPPAETMAAPVDPAALPTLRSGQDVFARLRQGLTPDACDAGSNSARWRQRYAGSPVAFTRRIASVLPLLDFVSNEVERAGLPAEFTFIPLVESWYQPAAIGPGGPAGMWQMIATTAKNHGIHIRPGYDGRLSPVESTRAALSYLKVLDHMFGNWQAIVMAYNAGEGRLQKALRRAGSRVANAAQRRPHGLSNITYDYVAKLQALSCLVQQPQRHGLRLPLETRFAPLSPLLMDERVRSLDQFATLHGTDAALLRRLNPGFRDGKVVAGVPRLVLSPPGASAPVPAGLPPQLPAPALAVVAPEEMASAELAEVPPGDELASLSGDADPEEFPDFLPTVVPTALPAATGTAVPATPLPAPAPEAAPALAEPPQPVHEVRDGDTLASIAQHYHLPIEQILRANRIERDARLRPGQRLRLVP